MAHKPSFLPVLKVFGLNPKSLAYFLDSTNAIIAGGAPASAFFGKPLEDTQDLDIWIPTPCALEDVNHPTSPPVKWDNASYIKLLRNNVFNYFERNQAAPSNATLLSKSLNHIIKKYKGNYRRISMSDVDFAEYTKTTMNNIMTIDTFENPWTSRRIQVIYVYDLSPQDILSKFDLDVCKFYVNGSDSEFLVKHHHSAYTLTKLRLGVATVCSPYDILYESYMTDYQRKRLDERIAKYKARGYTVISETTGFVWGAKEELLPDPEESFWQDFKFTSSDISDRIEYESMRDIFRHMLSGAGCDFVGSDTEGNVDVLAKYHTERMKDDCASGDNWRYIWRFTWNAETKEENIYLRSMVLQNPF
jgi:hypothetical protein